VLEGVLLAFFYNVMPYYGKRMVFDSLDPSNSTVVDVVHDSMTIKQSL